MCQSFQQFFISNNVVEYNRLKTYKHLEKKVPPTRKEQDRNR